MQYQFTKEYQSLIVAALLQDSSILTAARDALKPEYFEGAAEQEIVRTVTEFYDQYRQRPLRDTLVQIIYDRAKRLGWSDDDRNKLVTDLYRIYAIPLQTADIHQIRDKVAQFGRTQALKIAMMEAINIIADYEKGEPVELTSVEHKIQKALIVGAAKTMGISLPQHMPDIRALCRSNELANVDRRVATGYPTMDRFLGGGLGGGEIAFIIAPSNKGKSMILVNLAAAAFRQSKKVVYFTFEMKEPEVASRFAANLTDCEISKVQENDAHYLKKVQELSFVLATRNLRIIYVKPSDATPNNLRSILMTIETVEGWTPDAIFVDYLDEMVAPTGKREDDTYNAYGKLTTDLLSIAVDYKCPLWTASQVNRAGYENEPSLEDVGRSMQKIDKSEFVIAPVQNEEQAKKGKMILKILKNRRGPGVGWRISCTSILTKARIIEENTQ